jgi:zinc and cadmium transporter
VREYAAALALSLAGSLGGLLTSSVLLVFGDAARRRIIPWLLSFAVGTLLGASLLALLPEALARLEPRTVCGTVLGGILAFFVLEKLVLWRHCHTEACDIHGTTAALVLASDAIHNFVDGAIIGAAVYVSFPLGVSTALAVATHEIPQELGDLAILLGSGYGPWRAFRLNLYSGLAALVGATAMLLAVDQAPNALPYVLPFAAGGFLYVAMADLIPDLHRGVVDARALRQFLLILAGIATMAIL